eukprot:CAMPEP_0185024180 /NCGR_PEP_ID=MMETSP1103-20130426/7150_1 /TAXON_ID=36769 /ORGANISM="Paraphysomonas bandaiensis, Strain Caron Lab Isolate" /LENGTH=194 /DNA_ID=CAMNT_0027557077 /DNA_START=110 /DNA_END=694 /DNA_ORIENTATION=-
MYNHVKTLAEHIKSSIEDAGCEATLLQVPETLPAGVLEKMHAPAKDESIPIATASMLTEYDGILFGIPTRFGMAAAQMKAFMDSTGGLWQSGGLVGKTAGIFFSTGTQNGGQETTAMTWVTQLAHHGMIYVPLGYINPAVFDLSTPHGGSAWGPGTLAGADGSRQPSDLEVGVAKSYGAHFAGITAALKAGRSA